MHKKIYYLPGLISLMLLAPLLMNYLLKREVFKAYRIIKMWAYKKDQLDDGKDRFTIRPSLPKRIYEELIFSGNPAEDKAKLDSINSAIFELQKTENTEKAFSIHFSYTSYQIFISTLDLCQNKALRQMMIDGVLFIWYEEPEQSTSSITPVVFCGTVTDWLSRKREEHWKEQLAELKKRKMDFVYFLWPSWILFLVIIAYHLK